MFVRRGVVRSAVSAVLALVIVLVLGGRAVAAPPPPNPGDAELGAGRAEADERAGRVGELTGRLTGARALLHQLGDDVARAMEDTNKALVDVENARAEAARAAAEAEAARAEADAAAASVEEGRDQLDEFAGASFQQGSTVGSITAFVGARSPEDLLARAQMLEAVSGSGLDAMEQLERARTEQGNKDAAARAALGLAEEKRAAADRAAHEADAAQRAAVRARQEQESRAAEVERDRAAVEAELVRAHEAVGGLEAQRGQYAAWDAARRAEEEAAARAAAEAVTPVAPPPAPPVPPAPSPVPPPAPRPVAVTAPVQQHVAPAPAPVGDVEVVIARALRQLGVRYSWGGGNYDGPTIGIRDGGVADSFGDYRSVGFDCSGLMMYAFAGAGVRLPHYSGYQYTAGRRVPLAQARRGDMLFWGPNGGTHVALYLGDGMMVEAPHSGASVRVAPVRYGGIVPHATRLL
nr:NlpC/P60 family protein [Umezawaea beigongshangensis]